MDKKIIIGIIIAIIVIIVGVAIYIITGTRTNTLNGVNTENEDMEIANNTNITNQDNTNVESENSDNNESKTLVVYYSAQNHTKAVAEKIASNLNADMFEIIPEQIYTSEDLDWTDNTSRVSKEHDNEALREIQLISTTVNNWEDYDTILIGYPIWWGIAAWPVDTFIKANDFTGKTVIPFCTSSSSGLGQSGELLEQQANGGNWLEGHRFRSNPSDSDINSWTDSLN